MDARELALTQQKLLEEVGALDAYEAAARRTVRPPPGPPPPAGSQRRFPPRPPPRPPLRRYQFPSQETGGPFDGARGSIGSKVSTGVGTSMGRDSFPGTVSGVSTGISEAQLSAAVAAAEKSGEKKGALEYKARMEEQRAAEALKKAAYLEAQLQRATGRTTSSMGTSMGGAPKSVLSGDKVGRMGFVVLGVIFSICVILAFVSLDRYNNGDVERAKTMVMGIIIAIAISLALGIGYIIYLNGSKDEIWWGEMKTKDKLIFSLGLAVLIGILVMSIYIHKDIEDGTKAKDVEGLFIGMSSLCLIGLFGSGYAFGRTDTK